MMGDLLRRGEQLARAAQRRSVGEISARLKELMSGVSIEVDEARVMVSGRGLLKRWLIDPQLRFLAGDRG
jgi:hypothetical protein